MPHPTGPTDPNVQKLVNGLKRKKERFYLVLARHLEKPRRKKSGVNVGKIDKYAQHGESVVVPGKVLGSGEITKKINVYACGYSQSAKKKITRVGGKCLALEELLGSKEKGRILI